MAPRTDMRDLSPDNRARGPEEIAQKRKEQAAMKWDAKTLRLAMSRIYADRHHAQREQV